MSSQPSIPHCHPYITSIMHLSAALLASILTLTSAAPLAESQPNPAPTLSKRGCFSGGESWGVYQSNALSAARSACSAGLGNNAVYNGSMLPPFSSP